MQYQDTSERLTQYRRQVSDLRGNLVWVPEDKRTLYHAGLPDRQPQLSGGQTLRPRRPPVRSPAYQSFTVSRHLAMCGVLVWYSNAALLT